MKGEEVLQEHGWLGIVMTYTVERKIRLSSKDHSFLQLPFVGCIGKIKRRGSTQGERWC
jgi:hypothetical protein